MVLSTSNNNDVQNTLPQERYIPFLETINGVSLTRREIDILACNLSGKTAKKIASFLCIAPKTVENHIRNIMLKFGYHSQEELIDSIEKSNAFIPLKKHYTALLIQAAFEEVLKKIAVLINQKSPSYLLVDSKAYFARIRSRNQHQLIIILQLQKHLGLAGIKLPAGKMPQAFLELEDFKAVKNYYFWVFEILATLLKDVSLDHYISEFKGKYNKLEDAESWVAETENILSPKGMDKPIHKPILKISRLFAGKDKRKDLLPLGLLYGSILLCILSAVVLFYTKTSQIKLGEELSWNLPRQDHLFIGREKLLEDLGRKLQSNFESGTESIFASSAVKTSKRLAISACAGLGGIGKTQLALQYIHHPKRHYHLRAWFVAENIDQLNQQYIEFAKTLGYCAENKSIDRVKTYVKQWLLEHPGWLVVYDNVSEYEEIASYLPEKGGHIILTTRTQVWPSNIEVLPIDIMTEKESMHLIKQLTKHRDEEKKAMGSGNENEEKNELEEAAIKQLAKTLGFLPLAMAQASAYIQQNKISVTEYLALYKKYETNLLADNTLPEGTYSLPVAATWHVSLNAIINDSNSQDPNVQNSNLQMSEAKYSQYRLSRQEALLALDLLSVCAYLAPEEIPRYLLLAWLKEAHPEVSNPELVLPKLIGELWRYSLISTSEKDVTVHRLMQMVVRHQHSISKKLNQSFPRLTKTWYQTLLKTAHKEISREHTQVLEDEYRKQKLLPHLQSLVAYYDKLWSEDNADPVLAVVLQDIGRTFEHFMCAFKAAKPYYIRVLKIYEKLHSSSHPAVTLALMDLGENYRHCRDFKEAKKLLEQALTVTEQVFGKEHARIGVILSNLGQIYRNLGDFPKSLIALERALKINEQEYGKGHVQVTVTLRTLNGTYLMLEDYDKALSLIQRSYEILEKIYGADHWAIAPTLANLGATYRELGDYEKALQYFDRTLKIFEAKYGKDHPWVSIALSHFGHTYVKLKDFKKAREVYERALEIVELEYGKEHPQVANTLMNLGNTYRNLGQLDKSLTVLERALKVNEQAYDKDNWLMVPVLDSLVDTYNALGNLEKSKACLERAEKLPRIKQPFW